jgi:uncharacterized protein (DUF2267 family)
MAREGWPQEWREQRSETKTQQTFARFLEDLGTRFYAKSSEIEHHKDQLARVAVVVLAALEQRLAGGEPDDLHAQLPVKLQELLDALPPQARQTGVPVSGVEFVQAVANVLGGTFDHAEQSVRAVFATVRDHISDGEAKDVESQLPPELWSLWALSH